jgi:hypothetical protein
VACESIGLFARPELIGFQRQWFDLIRRKGYELSGFELRPIANALPSAEDLNELHYGAPSSINRHLTALSRDNLSAPVQCLVRHGLLEPTKTFFDYGCGKGDDLATLLASGYTAFG